MFLSSPWGGFSWHDNSPLQFTSWLPGEPTRVNEHGTEEHCGEMFISGAWNDEDCNSERGYICQRPKGIFKLPKNISFLFKYHLYDTQ